MNRRFPAAYRHIVAKNWVDAASKFWLSMRVGAEGIAKEQHQQASMRTQHHRARRTQTTRHATLFLFSRRGLVWPAVMACLVMACLVISIGMMRGESSIRGYYELQKSRDLLKQAVEDLKAENSSISDEIVRIKKSPSYARKVLRDKYHVTDENEDIVFFPE